MFYQTRVEVVQGENPYDIVDEANVILKGKMNGKVYIKRDGDLWYAFVSFSEVIRDTRNFVVAFNE